MTIVEIPFYRTTDSCLMQTGLDLEVVNRELLVDWMTSNYKRYGALLQ